MHKPQHLPQMMSLEFIVKDLKPHQNHQNLILVQNSQGHLPYLQMADLSITILDNSKVKKKSTGGHAATGDLRVKLFFFTTTKDDINDQFTIDLNNTKARFFKKSPRSKSPKIQPTYIRFFESDYSLTKNLKLPKTDE